MFAEPLPPQGPVLAAADERYRKNLYLTSYRLDGARNFLTRAKQSEQCRTTAGHHGRPGTQLQQLPLQRCQFRVLCKNNRFKIVAAVCLLAQLHLTPQARLETNYF